MRHQVSSVVWALIPLVMRKRLTGPEGPTHRVQKCRYSPHFSHPVEKRICNTGAEFSLIHSKVDIEL
ncbi:hypothetical protein ACLB2K_061439 [Fragaria x ananassa]